MEVCSGGYGKTEWWVKRGIKDMGGRTFSGVSLQVGRGESGRLSRCGYAARNTIEVARGLQDL